MSLIKIKHKNLADGVLIDAREFDATKHELFDAPVGAKADDANNTDDQAQAEPAKQTKTKSKG